MGSELWARSVQLGVCFAWSWAGHCRREAKGVQQYREIRSRTGAGAVWTETSRRHLRFFPWAYRHGPSSPPLSHQQWPWCFRTVGAGAQPSAPQLWAPLQGQGAFFLSLQGWKRVALETLSCLQTGLEKVSKCCLFKGLVASRHQVWTFVEFGVNGTPTKTKDALPLFPSICWTRAWGHFSLWKQK